MAIKKSMLNVCWKNEKLAQERKTFNFDSVDVKGLIRVEGSPIANCLSGDDIKNVLNTKSERRDPFNSYRPLRCTFDKLSTLF
jgi:hypothetical protein